MSVDWMLVAQGGESSGILFWGAVVIGLLVVGVFVVTFVRKRLRDEGDLGTPGGGGFDLTTLRELHRAGKLTTEEFEKAKHAIVEAVKRSAARKEAENSAGKAKGFEVRPPRDEY